MVFSGSPDVKLRGHDAFPCQTCCNLAGDDRTAGLELNYALLLTHHKLLNWLKMATLS